MVRKLRALPLAAMAVLLAGCGASLSSDPKAGLTLTSAIEAKPSPVALAQVKPPAGGSPEQHSARTTPAEAARAAATPTSIEALAGQATPGSTAYRIGPQDVLEISVFKVPELSKSVQVAATGEINYPLLGEVPASGKTAAELERELGHRLSAKYLQKPQVTVFVKEYNSQRVLMDGAFVKPGVLPHQGKASLLQLIAQSGGMVPTADATVVVFRTVDGKRTAAKFDVDDIRSGKAQDPAIQPGDVIVASSSVMKEGLEKILKVLPVVGSFATVL